MLLDRTLRTSALALCVALAACSSLKNKADAPVNPTATAQPAASANGNTGADSANASAAGNADALSANGLGNGKAGSKHSADGSSIPDESLVHFAYDSDAISAADSDILAAHAAYLKAHGHAHVRLEGHADERGTQEYNMALGERRAKAARFFMVSHGVSISQIEIVSYGKTKPVDTSDTEEAWAKNRRAEVVYRD